MIASPVSHRSHLLRLSARSGKGARFCLLECGISGAERTPDYEVSYATEVFVVLQCDGHTKINIEQIVSTDALQQY